MTSTLLSRLRRARWVHGLQLLVFTCWVMNPFPGALSYWTDTNSDGVKEESANPAEGDSWWESDSDGDNLTNAQEALYGSDPYAIDSDHDGLRDDAEQALSDPTAPFDPWQWDSNQNGFSDYDELYQRLQGYNPAVNYNNRAPGSFFSYSDADGDGVKNPDDSDPVNNDRDGDGILNWNDTGYMDDATNGYVPPPPASDPGVMIGGNWYPTGTLDSDGDGAPDQLDPFAYGSFWYNGTEYGGAWSDRDGDGIPDPADRFPDGSYWYNSVEYGGTITDQDGDTIPDALDPWPTIAGSFHYWQNDTTYPGVWSDQDGDGTPDPADATPYGTYYWNGMWYAGPWVDQDGDGIPDAFDSWPTIAGSYTYNGTEYPGTLSDSDGDGIPDPFDPYPNGGDPTYYYYYVPDSDGDGIPDYNDPTPNGGYWYNGSQYSGAWSDQDADGIPDPFDATPNGGYWYGTTEYAGTWSDMDGDSIPDPADATPNGGYWYNGTEYAGSWMDSDSDGVPDPQDGWPADSWNGAPHYTYNGSEYPGDITDDRDGDTIPDTADAYPDDNENNADNDSDGLSNYVERTQLGTDPDKADTDGEGLTDYEELYTFHTNPLAQKTNPNQLYSDFYMVDQTDSDGDHIPDRIEQWYATQGYGMSASDPNDAAGDLDGDGYTNLQAYRQGWSFVANLNHYDNDNDGILDVLEDVWNAQYPGILSSSNADDAVLDYDSDGLMNFEEIALGMNPGSANSRTANVSDLQEWAWRGIIYGTGAIAFSGNVPAEWNVVLDSDSSGAPDGLEAFVAANSVTVPQRQASADYDGDGMSDVWEHRYSLNLRDAADAQSNADGDSLTNVFEFQQNRDPLINDDPPPPQIITSSLPDGTVGTAYSATVEAQSGSGPYNFVISAGALPEGLSLNANGNLSGTPTQAGASTFTVYVTDQNSLAGAREYSVNTSANTSVVTEENGDGANAGNDANGGTTGGGNTGTDGTQTGAGGGAGDGNNTQAVDPNALTVLASDMGGAKGSSFSGQVSASGGVLPYSFACSLPSGLSIDSETGRITGTPSSSGKSTATPQVTDATGTSASKPINIDIADEQQNDEQQSDDSNSDSQNDDEEEEDDEDDTETTQDDNTNTPQAPKVTSVSFKAAPLMDDLKDNNPIILISDSGNKTYLEPHWEDNSGGHHYPVAYISAASPYVEVTLDLGVSSGAAGQDDVTRIRTSTTSQQKIEGAGLEGFVLSGNTCTVKMQSLPEYTWFYNADEEGEEYTIDWEIKRPGDADFVSAGTTKHTVYVVRKAPLTPLRHETIFNISCRNATAIHINQPDQEVVDAIYGEFTDQKVYRVIPSTGTLQGEKMTYWTTGKFTTSQELLMQGDGQCNSWAELFRDVLAAQGIEAEIKTILPPSSYDYNRFKSEYEVKRGSAVTLNPVPVLFVKNWTPKDADEDGDLSAFFPKAETGVAAQGNDDPWSAFIQHSVVKLNSANAYYDPSYGGTMFTKLADWEDANLAGNGVVYGETLPGVYGQKFYAPGTPDVVRHYWFEKSNSSGSDDCNWK